MSNIQHDKLGFRQDINGLRAYAAISVLLFHFQVYPFQGGFVGVDVFFVISGYLMTAILYPTVQAKQLNIFDFYLRRLKRVFPALFVMILLLFIGAHYFLIELDINSLAREIHYSLLFVYNSFVFGKVNYFADTDVSFWLLHTWTLGVEFQFYLLLPLLLWGIHRFTKSIKKIFYTLLIISLGSYLLIVSRLFPQKEMFFLLHFRFWEFAAGGLLFLFNTYRPHFKASVIYSYLGWGILFLSVLFQSSESYPNPTTIIPVLSAFLILLPNKNTWFTNNILAQKLGNASYSIYLWHYPVYLFTRIMNEYLGFNNSFMLAIIGLGASLCLGFLSYVLVEKKLTQLVLDKRSKKTLALLIFVPMISLSFYGKHLYKSEKVLPLNTKKHAEYKLPSTKTVSFTDFNIYECDPDNPCLIGDKTKKPSFVLIGDSHATVLAYGLYELAKEKHKSFIMYTSPGCPLIFGVKSLRRKDDCPPHNVLVQKALQKSDLPVVLINRYNTTLLDLKEENSYKVRYYLTKKYDRQLTNFNQISDELALGFKNTACEISKKHDVYWLTSAPEFSRSVKKEVMRQIFYGQARHDVVLPIKEHLDRQWKIRPIQQQAAQQCGIKLINLDSVLCNENQCNGSVGDDIYFEDSNHLNQLGSKKVAPLLEFLFDK